MLVSIIVRTFNNENEILTTLRALNNQELSRGEFEIIVVDSGSTDRTLELVEGRVTRVIHQEGEYLPSRSLHAGIDSSAGEIIVFNNSDCVPQNRKWLEHLITPLLSNPSIGATFANQLPVVGAWEMVTKDHQRAFGCGKYNKKWKDFFSLASSATRAEILERYRFDRKLLYSEDIEWSIRLRNSGYKIEYIPTAMVFHSHNYSSSQLFIRFFNEGVAASRIFEFRRNVFFKEAGGFFAEVLRDIRFLVDRRKITNLSSSFRYRFVQRMAFFIGRNFGQGIYIKGRRV